MKIVKDFQLHPFFIPLLLIFSLLLTYLIFYYPPKNNNGVLGQSYPPPQPDILANLGGTVSIDPIAVLVEENTFPYDVYLWVIPRTMYEPLSLSGMWEITDMWEIWFRSFHNYAKVINPNKKYNLSIKYQPEQLISSDGILMPERSIKIITGPTYNGPWTVINNTAIDTKTHTASILTTNGGFFSLIAGWVSQPTPTPTVSVAPTPTITPTPYPTTQLLPTPTPSPTQYIIPTATTIISPSLQPTTASKVLKYKATITHRSFIDSVIDALLKLF